MNRYIIIAIVLLLGACKKQDISQEEKTAKELIGAALRLNTVNPEEVYNDIVNNAAGVFGFSAYKTTFTNYAAARFQGGYRSDMIDTGHDIEIGPNIRINALDQFNNYGYYDFDILPFYNSSCSLAFNYSHQSVPCSFQKNFKLPALIQMVNDGNLNSLDAIIREGTVIQWVTDADDENYIFISLRYDPNHPKNVNLGGSVFINSVLLDDDGTYSFTSGNMTGFPVGAFVEINLYRGNISIDTDAAGKKFVIGSISCQMLGAKYVP